MQIEHPGITDGEQTVANITFFQVKGLGSSIDSHPCPLYANGFQQTYVDVVIQAVNHHNQVIPLSPHQLHAITLVDYNRLEDLNALGYPYAPAQSDVDKLFELYPEVVILSPEDTTDLQVVRFWIKATEANNLKVGAFVEIDTEVYHTCESRVLPGGKTVRGFSNSSAVLTPVKQDYTLRATDLIRQRIDFAESAGRWDLDLFMPRSLNRLTKDISLKHSSPVQQLPGSPVADTRQLGGVDSVRPAAQAQATPGAAPHTGRSGSARWSARPAAAAADAR